jgi:hypothetical protein
VKRRAAALCLVLFAVYAATLGLDAFGRSDYAGDEPHYLLTAKSIVEDGAIDLNDEYRERSYRSFYPYELNPDGVLTQGRANEPHGIGFPLLIAPAYAVAGAKGVELFLAALAALAVMLAYLLALRVVPDPWALGATLAVGLSPPLVAYSTAVTPEIPAAAALCGATLLALRVSDRPSRLKAYSCFALLGALPWLGPKYLLAVVPIAVFAFRAIRRARRPVLALTALEVVGFSLALYVGLNEGLYGGPTPHAAEIPGQSATGADFPLGYLERAYRLVALLIDREYGLLRWAPALALVLLGVWVLWRERRSGIARAIPGLRDEQVAAVLCGAAALGQLIVAAFLSPTMFGDWFPGRDLVAVLPLTIPLAAIGVRRVPRVAAVLGLIGVAATVWLLIDVRWGGGGLVAGRPDAPWGPLEHAFPLFNAGSVYPFVLAGAIGLAAVALVALDSRHSHRLAGRPKRR